MVPLDLGAAYVHQLEEAQMLAAVRWRNKYEGVPPPLARALESADAFNRMFENGDNVVHTGSRVSAGGAAQSSRPPACELERTESEVSSVVHLREMVERAAGIVQAREGGYVLQE